MARDEPGGGTKPDHAAVGRRPAEVEITDARAAGLVKGGYVSSEEFAVDRSDIGDQIGWLAREDWNML